RQGSEQTVELGFGLGVVQAQDRGLAWRDRPRDSDEMAFVGQLGRGSCFGVLAVADLRLRGSSRNVERKGDEEFHALRLSHRSFDDGYVLRCGSAADSD